MKREPLKLDEYSGIYTTTPLIFWYRCESCGMEFKREKMFKKYSTALSNTGGGRWEYICGRCATDKKQAHDIFERLEARAVMPPPPPPRIVRNSQDLKVYDNE